MIRNWWGDYVSDIGAGGIRYSTDKSVVLFDWDLVRGLHPRLPYLVATPPLGIGLPRSGMNNVAAGETHGSGRQ